MSISSSSSSSSSSLLLALFVNISSYQDILIKALNKNTDRRILHRKKQRLEPINCVRPQRWRVTTEMLTQRSTRQPRAFSTEHVDRTPDSDIVCWQAEAGGGATAGPSTVLKYFAPTSFEDYCILPFNRPGFRCGFDVECTAVRLRPALGARGLMVFTLLA